MNLIPEIVTLPPRSFAGLQTHFIMAVAPDSNNLEVIPRLWSDFLARSGEVPATEPGVSYGLCDCSEAMGETAARPDEALYLAGQPVAADAKPPQGMVVWESPGGSYAKFIHRGRIERIAETMGFIYGKWLPSADFDRGRGPDLERYDARFDPTSDASILEIYIPVQAKA